MPLQIVKPHAREHRARKINRPVNLHQVLQFVNSATRNELYAIRIAMQQRPGWVLGKELVHGK